MKIRANIVSISIIVYLCSIFSSISTSHAKNNIYNFYSGPPNGNFTLVAEMIGEMANNANIPIRIIQSSGSNENIWRIDSNEAHFTISYSSHVYKAANGLLHGDFRKYKNIGVIGYLYGAQAHLVVKSNSNISSVQQLTNKRVGLGTKKSASGYQGTLFFEKTGLSNNIHGSYFSQGDSAKLLCQGKLDAVWVFSGFPNAIISETANTCKLKLLDLNYTEETRAFFDENPYFTETVIPGNTYKWVKDDTNTFEDSALLIANKNIPNQIVSRILELTYAPETIHRLTTISKNMRLMEKNDGKYGICVPLHEGAKKFYAGEISK